MMGQIPSNVREGLLEGPEGLPEWLEGLPEGPEGLPGGDTEFLPILQDAAQKLCYKKIFL